MACASAADCGEFQCIASPSSQQIMPVCRQRRRRPWLKESPRLAMGGDVPLARARSASRTEACRHAPHAGGSRMRTRHHERCRHVCRSACSAVALKESLEAPRGMPDGVKAEGKALAGVLVLAFRLVAVGVADDALAVLAFGNAPGDGRPLPAAAVSRVKRRLAMFGLPAPVPLDTRMRAWRCACRALRTPGRICP